MSDIDTSFVPTDPEDKKRIKDAIIEASGLKQIQKDKTDQIKDIVDFIHSEYGIPKKIIRKMIVTFHKQTYIEETTQSTIFEVLYENVGLGE